MSETAAISALTLFFEHKIDLQVVFPWSSWEAAFVSRWGLTPENNGAESKIYIEQEKLNPLSLNIHEAARAWHVGVWKIPQHMMSQMVKMENDFDLVEPKLVEEELDAKDWDKIQKQEEEFDPRNPKRRGRRVFLP